MIIFNASVVISTEEKINTNSNIQELLSFESLSQLKNALLVTACKNDPTIINLVLNNYLAPKTNKTKYRDELFPLIESQPTENDNIQIIRHLRNEIENSNYFIKMIQ